MYEFHIVNLATGEDNYIFGYDLTNAYGRTKLNPGEWVCHDREYID